MTVSINQLLQRARERKCSDVHITVGLPPMVRINGKIERLEGYSILTTTQVEIYINALIVQSQKQILESQGDIDFAYGLEGGQRVRVNIYKQQNNYTIAIRLLSECIPSLDELGLSTVLKTLTLTRGLFLVTGPTGSGKSTTLAALMNHINQTRQAHIITIEDPIEYTYKTMKCIIHQREIGRDTPSFSRALRAAMREDPDIIMVGEMRDLETIRAALTAAETGHLVLSTLHTKGSVSTIHRIVDIFPAEQQKQIRIQLASVLEGVLTQLLIPCKSSNKRVLATEILIPNDAVRNMIRDEKIHQINSVLETGNCLGMHTLDHHLGQLIKQNSITLEDAMDMCINTNNLKYYI